MADSFLNVKIFKDNSLLKDINESVTLENNQWTNYIKSLKTIQKSVNEFLTELVETEKKEGGTDDAENESSKDESEDDENNATISPCKKKKIK